MIKREHLKLAIEAISDQDPAIGFALDEMLGLGLLDAPYAGPQTTQDEDFSFAFEGERVPVSKFLFLKEGTAVIEQRLLIKYGEKVKKQELTNRPGAMRFQSASEEIRSAGLEFMVMHEIDHAMERIRKGSNRPAHPVSGKPEKKEEAGQPAASVSQYERLPELLAEMKEDERSLGEFLQQNPTLELFRGTVDTEETARFVLFPFCKAALMDAADKDMEFFHTRFLLNCLMRGLAGNLFACLVDSRIVGLIFVRVKERLFYRALEIVYLASVRGKQNRGPEPPFTVYRGVGTFLIAGVWLLWKTGMVKADELLLESEIGARTFYDSLGFRTRRFSEYVLKNPVGYLLREIVIMANNSPRLDPAALTEIKTAITRQIKALRKMHAEKGGAGRTVLISPIVECVKSTAHPQLVAAALGLLNKYRETIPESEGLIRSASRMEDCGSEVRS